MRSTVLSDDSVINFINAHFVPVTINVTTDGFPQAIPAMKHVQRIYNRNWRFAFGFASCSAFDEEGKIPLGISSPGKNKHVQGYLAAQNFIKFLQSSLEKHRQITRIKGNFRRGNFDMTEITQFIMKSVAEMRQNVTSLMQFRQEHENTLAMMRKA